MNSIANILNFPIEEEVRMVSRTCTCELCQAEYTETIAEDLLKYSIQQLCDACSDSEKEREEWEARESHRNAVLSARKESWQELCPPIYQDTNLGHSGLSKSCLAALAEWDWRRGYGIGLAGASGKGKTRLAFYKLEQIHMEGVKVFALSSKRLERQVQNQFSDDAGEKRLARDILAKCRSVEVLFIDDIGKEKYTERVASEFYDLIEYRTSYCLPIIWTSNASLGQLAQSMGENHSGPTLRRIQQFSHVIVADAPPKPLDHSDKPIIKKPATDGRYSSDFGRLTSNENPNVYRGKTL